MPARDRRVPRRDGIDEPIHEVDWTCVRWRRESDASAIASRRLVSTTPTHPHAHLIGHRRGADGARARAREGECAAARLLANAQAQIGLRAWAASSTRRQWRWRVIVFGSSITEPDAYARCARAGLRARGRARLGDLRATPTAGSIFRKYNLILDQVASRDDLEALVLVHQDAEIADPHFCSKLRGRWRPRGRRRRLRRSNRHAQHRLVGGIRHLGVASLHRYEELGGGEITASRGTAETLPPLPAPARSRPSTASSWRCRHGWCATCASTSRSGHCTATTSTSVCRSRRRKEGDHRDFRVIHHHSLELIEQRRDAGSRPT